MSKKNIKAALAGSITSIADITYALRVMADDAHDIAGDYWENGVALEDEHGDIEGARADYAEAKRFQKAVTALHKLADRVSRL